MTTGQDKRFDQINDIQEKLTNAWVHYWQRYSSLNSWQFWLLILFLVAPLIVLYFRMDRKRALQLGFFGFSMHVWLSKFDELVISNGLWNYPYTTVPYLASSFALDASLSPVAFMLVYQWTLSHKRNFYIYTIGLSFALAFLFRPALTTFGLFSVDKISYYGLLLLGYVVVLTISKWTTNLFVYFQNQNLVSIPSAPQKKTEDEVEKPVIKATYKKRSLLGRIFRRKETT